MAQLDFKASEINARLAQVETNKENISDLSLKTEKIETETTSELDDEVIYSDDEGVDEYAKIGTYGIKAKEYLDINGNPVARNIVNIYTTDTEVEILTKMLNALAVGNCDVYWQFGTYTFAEVYIYMRDTLGWSWTMELPLGNNNRYYFNGSTIISNAPEEEYVTTDDFVASRNIFGVMAGKTSLGTNTFPSNKDFELHDGILINNGGTYCVHDEMARAGADVYYRHCYYNMVMTYNTATTTTDVGKCIGGGAGVKGVVIINGCAFTSDHESTPDVSWHGLKDESATDTYMLFNIQNSYFSQNLRISSDVLDGDTYTYICCGNSTSSEPVLASTSTSIVYKFNNIIHS